MLYHNQICLNFKEQKGTTLISSAKEKNINQEDTEELKPDSFVITVRNKDKEGKNNLKPKGQLLNCKRSRNSHSNELPIKRKELSKEAREAVEEYTKFNQDKTQRDTLSQTTLDKMNFIQTNQCFNSKDESKSSYHEGLKKHNIDQCPLRIKYEEILNYNKRELLLPTKYKELLCLFDYIDTFISNSKQHGNSNDMLKLETLISNCRKYPYLTYDSLCQLLFLVPQLYLIRYSNSELYIDIPNDYTQRMTKTFFKCKDNGLIAQRAIYDYITSFDSTNRLSRSLSKEELYNRMKFVRKQLVNLVKEAHDAFLLEKLNIELNDFDPFELKTWHHEFELNESANEIPLLDLNYFHQEDIEMLKDFMIEMRKIEMKLKGSSIHISNLIKMLISNESEYYCNEESSSIKEKVKKMIIKASIEYPNRIRLRTKDIFGMYVEFLHLSD